MFPTAVEAILPNDKCDSGCGRPAKYRARFSWADGSHGQLLFCTHHRDATQEKLISEGWWFE